MSTTTDTTTAPVEVVSPIRPSEAIRLGCLLAPTQSFTDWGYGRTACVNRALLLGLGQEMAADEHEYSAVDSLMHGSPTPPCGWDCPDDPMGWLKDVELSSTLVHLNDRHRWSRERIADWLEGLGL